MSNAFEYKPKFVDIRVKKSGAAKTRAAPAAAAVETACDFVGCKREGSHKAPKGRDMAGEYWNFCVEHVTDYNRRWNYFSGMTDDELAAYRKREEVGHRPTWTFRSGRLDKHTASLRGIRADQANDPFAVFGGAGEAAAPKPRRRLSRLQAMALEVMQLEENANASEIRTRYAELVKRWHPDSNGGDRGAEENLQRVLKAYQVLKGAGLV